MFFQAVGLIKASIKKEENPDKPKSNSFKVQLGDFEFSLVGKKDIFRYLSVDLKKNPEPERWLMLYPKVLHLPGNAPHSVYFELKAFSVKKPEIELDHLEFKLAGLWQFIPVCKVPVISIFKNFSEERLESYKHSEPAKKVKETKPAHIPLFWKDAVVSPFRFNPKVPKEEQVKPYFVEIKARFFPDKQTFGFESLRGLPTEQTPKFMKVRKDDKQALLKEKNKDNKPQYQSKNNKKVVTKLKLKPQKKPVESATPKDFEKPIIKKRLL